MIVIVIVGVSLSPKLPFPSLPCWQFRISSDLLGHGNRSGAGYHSEPDLTPHADSLATEEGSSIVTGIHIHIRV